MPSARQRSGVNNRIWSMRVVCSRFQFLHHDRCGHRPTPQPIGINFEWVDNANHADDARKPEQKKNIQKCQRLVPELLHRNVSITTRALTFRQRNPKHHHNRSTSYFQLRFFFFAQINDHLALNVLFCSNSPPIRRRYRFSNNFVLSVRGSNRLQIIIFFCENKTKNPAERLAHRWSHKQVWLSATRSKRILNHYIIQNTWWSFNSQPRQCCCCVSCDQCCRRRRRRRSIRSRRRRPRCCFNRFALAWEANAKRKNEKNNRSVVLYERLSRARARPRL